MAHRFGDLTGSLRARRVTTWLLFAIVAVSLLAALFFVYQTIEVERAQRAQASETSEILLELRTVGRTTLNAETGQRGYMITLDRRYLEPYLAARAQYRPVITRLRRLVEPDSTDRQEQLLDEIEALTESKFGEMNETVQLLENGELLNARRRILTDEGQETMLRLRRAIREMEVIENRLLLDASRETALAEGRVLPLLGMVLALLLIALGFGYRLVTRTARAEAEAAQATALAEARDRADLLARELNHRVKNLFAVILAIVRMSARDAPEAKPVVERIADRITALLTAHEVTQGTLEKPVASLKALVETTLSPYRSERSPATVEGGDVQLPARQVTPLGLVLHELTTNAVKYGAWNNGGSLDVSWRVEDDMLTIDWRENFEMANTEIERTGFGSMLMTGAARQLRGTIDREFSSVGVAVKIVIPLETI